METKTSEFEMTYRHGDGRKLELWLRQRTDGSYTIGFTDHRDGKTEPKTLRFVSHHRRQAIRKFRDMVQRVQGAEATIEARRMREAGGVT